MAWSWIDRLTSPWGRYAATDAAMRRWGLDHLCRVGRAYNSLPRFMMMHALQSPACRDLAQTFTAWISYPASPDAPRLRRMVLS